MHCALIKYHSFSYVVFLISFLEMRLFLSLVCCFLEVRIKCPFEFCLLFETFLNGLIYIEVWREKKSMILYNVSAPWMPWHSRLMHTTNGRKCQRWAYMESHKTWKITYQFEVYISLLLCSMLRQSVTVSSAHLTPFFSCADVTSINPKIPAYLEIVC
jgi:hypothetical protein